MSQDIVGGYRPPTLPSTCHWCGVTDGHRPDCIGIEVGAVRGPAGLARRIDRSLAALVWRTRWWLADRIGGWNYYTDTDD